MDMVHSIDNRSSGNGEYPELPIFTVKQKHAETGRHIFPPVPHLPGTVQSFRLDMEKDKTGQSDYTPDHSRVMADTRPDRRYALILSAYRLAFQDTGQAWCYRSSSLLYQVPGRQADRIGFQSGPD